MSVSIEAIQIAKDKYGLEVEDTSKYVKIRQDGEVVFHGTIKEFMEEIEKQIRIDRESTLTINSDIQEFPTE